MVYDGLASAQAPLLRVDQLTGSRAGEVFVCEDIATDEVDMGVIGPDGGVAKFLSITGPQHRGSELTGVTFDPSGSRMYVSSQRAFAKSELEPGPGAIYELTGPFRGAGLGANPPDPGTRETGRRTGKAVRLAERREALDGIRAPGRRDRRACRSGGRGSRPGPRWTGAPDLRFAPARLVKSAGRGGGGSRTSAASS